MEQLVIHPVVMGLQLRAHAHGIAQVEGHFLGQFVIHRAVIVLLQHVDILVLLGVP